MFQNTKIRIKEGARRAGRIVGSSAQQQQQQQPTSGRGDHHQDENAEPMERGFAVPKQPMSNGKGPSTGVRMFSNLYMQPNLDDYGEDVMDISDMDDSIGGNVMDLDDMMFSGGMNLNTMSMFGHGPSRRGMMHEKHVDKVVHTNFFNKFDDLLDQDDLE